MKLLIVLLLVAVAMVSGNPVRLKDDQRLNELMKALRRDATPVPTPPPTPEPTTTEFWKKRLIQRLDNMLREETTPVPTGEPTTAPWKRLVQKLENMLREETTPVPTGEPTTAPWKRLLNKLEMNFLKARDGSAATGPVGPPPDEGSATGPVGPPPDRDIEDESHDMGPVARFIGKLGELMGFGEKEQEVGNPDSVVGPLGKETVSRQ